MAQGGEVGGRSFAGERSDLAQPAPLRAFGVGAGRGQKEAPFSLGQTRVNVVYHLLISVTPEGGMVGPVL